MSGPTPCPVSSPLRTNSTNPTNIPSCLCHRSSHLGSCRLFTQPSAPNPIRGGPLELPLYSCVRPEQSTTMGSLQPVSLPTWSRPNGPVRPSPLLVAIPRGRRQGVLCPEKDLPLSSGWPTPSSPCPRSTMISHLPTSQSNTTILTMVDVSPRWSTLPPSRNSRPQQKWWISSCLMWSGCTVSPRTSSQTRGHQFTSKVWQAFCHGIGATVSHSSGYHPQTNGQAERANQALEATLRCVTTSKPTSWSLHLPQGRVLETNHMQSTPILCSCDVPPGSYKAPPGPDSLLSYCYTPVGNVSEPSLVQNVFRVIRLFTF